MFIAKISLIGSAYAAYVSKNWPKSSNCTGLVVLGVAPGGAPPNDTVCPSTPTSCSCHSDLCRTVDYCNPASTSKIVSDSFGSLSK